MAERELYHRPSPKPTWTPEEVAKYWWEDVFHYGAYTNYHQVDYLVKKAAKTASDPWQTVLRDPNIVSRNITTEDLKNDESATFKKTWASPGRCTSFTIRVIRHLEEHDSPSFDFKIYDLNGHRVARCERTGILIDSSSARGSITLPNGEWTTLEDEGDRGTTQDESVVSWKWIDGKSKFERGGKQSMSSTVLSVQDSMTICLNEVKKRFEPLFLFRSFTEDRAHYHGMIKWVVKKKQLHLIYELQTRNARIISFDEHGTTETKAECVKEVADFIKNYGGPMGLFQWRAGVGESTATAVHDKLWNAAIGVWGYPRLT
ncbi:hypothetical protein GGR54DRAFT_639604 [Hypoxylon sp. NC1633]|nr:hypothetical protein GGR54DRAFT_639604 [Hypoxylon sp. NC1633]